RLSRNRKWKGQPDSHARWRRRGKIADGPSAIGFERGATGNQRIVSENPVGRNMFCTARYGAGYFLQPGRNRRYRNTARFCAAQFAAGQLARASIATGSAGGGAPASCFGWGRLLGPA